MPETVVSIFGPVDAIINDHTEFKHGMEWATNRSENSERLPLLTTKLHIARTRPDAVPRPRLVARLNEGCRRRLTIVSAPAGFGKTTLLSEWAHFSRQNVAWMSIDEGDNIPVRFWTYFVGALQRLRAGIGASSLESLYSLQPPPIEVILTTLINDLAQMPGELVLVLDDYHAIDLEPIHAALSFFIEHMPAQVHLVITSRVEPPLRTTRLRAHGELTEIRAADLRFTPQEAVELLKNIAGAELTAEDISRLAARMEGWGAGLQLAGLAMQGRKHTNGTLRAVTGTHRYVADYIIMEILERQPDAIRAFLLRTSILDRLSAPLCDAVIGGQGSEEMLRRLERANLFISPVEDDEEWYRYHNLFTEVLRERLRQLFPTEVEVLHRRASAWYQEQGLMAEAIHHLLKGGDTEQALRFAELCVENMLAAGRLETLLQWRDAFPAAEIRNRPRLALAFAWALVLSGQAAAAETYLEYCRRFARPDPNDGLSDLAGHLDTLNTFLASTKVTTEPVEEPARRPSAPSSSATPIFSLDVEDRSAAVGEQEEPEADTTARQPDTRGRFGLAEALPRMARLQMGMGRLRAAMKTFQQAMDMFDDMAGDEWRSLAACHIGIGEIYYQRNDLDNAMVHVTEALNLSRQGHDTMIIHDVHALLARLHQARGDIDGALDAIAQAEELLASVDDAAPFLASLATCRTQALLAQGNVQAANRWAQEYGTERALYSTEAERFQQLTLAETALAQFRAEEALELLAPLLSMAEPKELNDTIIRTLILQALAFDQQGDSSQAIAVLARALRLAEPEGYLRPFIEEGAPVTRLLRLLRESQRESDEENPLEVDTEYLDGLLAASGMTPRKMEWEMTTNGSSEGSYQGPVNINDLLTPISEREIEVLKLISEGKTNASIADSLFISLSTVKTHINNLYSKLGVESRTQALARAREIQLL